MGVLDSPDLNPQELQFLTSGGSAQDYSVPDQVPGVQSQGMGNLSAMSPPPPHPLIQSDPPPPGKIKGMLFGFLGGMRDALLHDAGLETPYEKQIKAQQIALQQQQVDAQTKNAQTNEDYRKLQAQILQQGRQPSSPQGVVFADLLTRVNPETGQKYTPLEAMRAMDKPQADKPDTATQVKQAFMNTLAKANVPPQVMSNVSALSKFIDASPALSDEEKRNAKAYLAANTTPASSGTVANIRVMGMMQRPYAVIDRQTGQSVMATAEQIAGDPQRYMNAPQGAKDMNSLQLIDDMRQGSQAVRSALANMSDDEAFSDAARARLAVAMRSTDPRGAVNAFINSKAAEGLSDKQIALIDAEVSLMERALSMRQLGGMGQGSETQREAIIKALPGIGSGSRKRALDQLDRFDNQTNIFEKSFKQRVGNIGGQGGGIKINRDKNGRIISVE